MTTSEKMPHEEEPSIRDNYDVERGGDGERDQRTNDEDAGPM